MEDNDGRRSATGGGGLPRSKFVDDFFDADPFRNFDPPQGRLPRTFTEQNGRFFDDDDVGRFFDGFPSGRRPFHDEPAFLRSSLPRRPFPPARGEERPIPVQHQQTTPQRSPILERKDTQSAAPFHHQRSKSHYDNADNHHRNDWGHYQQQPFAPNQADQQQHFRHNFPSQHPSDPNVHRIQIRQEMPRQQFVEINNAQPNYSNGSLNPDKRRRFSNAQQRQNDHKHNYANIRSPSIPNITIDDYSDGRAGEEEDEKKPSPIPTVIPLPAPAIPLPAPEGMMQNVEKCEDNGDTKTEELNSKGIENENEGRGEQDKNAVPPINFAPVAESGDCLIKLLDDTERQVEILRETVAKLEQEKETILGTIKNIKLTGGALKLTPSDRDELELNADRILTRCRAVDVCVNTPRNEQQIRALEQVNAIIQSVVDKMQDDLSCTKARIVGMLNACMPDETGHIDDKFQSLIIACTADDQKKIRRRLTQIMEQIEHAQHFSSPISH